MARVLRAVGRNAGDQLDEFGQKFILGETRAFDRQPFGRKSIARAALDLGDYRHIVLNSIYRLYLDR